MLAPYNAFRKTHDYIEFVAAAEFYLHFQSPVFLVRVSSIRFVYLLWSYSWPTQFAALHYLH